MQSASALSELSTVACVDWALALALAPKVYPFSNSVVFIYKFAKNHSVVVDLGLGV